MIQYFDNIFSDAIPIGTFIAGLVVGYLARSAFQWRRRRIAARIVLRNSKGKNPNYVNGAKYAVAVFLKSRT